MISCNTVLIGNFFIHKNYKTTQSHNILTFNKIVEKEFTHIMLSGIQFYFEERKEFLEKQKDFSVE